MILTCPECASRYFVDDSKVGATGRVVRCANCGARWTAKNDEAQDLFEPPAGGPSPSDAPAAPGDAANGAAASASADSEIEPPVSALPGEELPKVFRARADADRRLREATATGVIWAGMAAAMASLLVAAVIFRIDVVRLWPSAAGAYAAVGLPVNNVGLVIESLKAEPSLEDGHAAVTISGVLRNIQDRPVSAPPLRLSLLNGQGKRVAGKIAAAADPLIPPGETRHFAITILDPPLTAKDLEIGFALEPGAAKAVKTALKGAGDHAPEPELALRGAQPDAPHTEQSPGEEAGHETLSHETSAPSPAPAETHEAAAHHD
jgi:predicted Zn finger-like uncharacterized protein